MRAFLRSIPKWLETYEEEVWGGVFLTMGACMGLALTGLVYAIVRAVVGVVAG